MGHSTFFNALAFLFRWVVPGITFLSRVWKVCVFPIIGALEFLRRVYRLSVSVFLNSKFAVIAMFLTSASLIYTFVKKHIFSMLYFLGLPELEDLVDLSILDKYVDTTILGTLLSDLVTWLVVYYGFFTSGLSVFFLSLVHRLLTRSIR